MPIYDFECDRCGPFSSMRPMAQCGDPLACPACGAQSPRAFLTAPAIVCGEYGNPQGDGSQREGAS